MKSLIAALVVGAVALGAVPAPAQEVEIVQPAPPRVRERVVVPPGDHYDATRPSDADYYREAPRVRHDPTFVGPLSSRFDTPRGTGRAGIAGWTSPNIPVGPRQLYEQREGWFALGFAIEWGGPPAVRRPAR